MFFHSYLTQIHREAVYYNIKPLIKQLEETPPMFGELVGRQQFLSRVPHYRENIEVRGHTPEDIFEHNTQQLLYGVQLSPSV